MYPIADMLIRIKNAQAVRKERILIPFSGLKLAVAEILKTAGFICEVEKKKRKLKNTERIFLELRLDLKNQKPISGIRIISKPSRRIYQRCEKIRPTLDGFGVSIFSTSKGVMTGEEAQKNKLGGEFLAEIW